MTGLLSRISSLDRKLLRDLWRIKGQALAIAAVMAAGVALVVMTEGMLSALDDTMRAYYERHRFADVFAVVKRAPTRVLADIRETAGVSDAEGRVNGLGLVDLPGVSAPISARVMSYDPNARAPINRLFVTSGAMMRAEQPREAMVLAPFAEAHGLRPGDDIAVTMNGTKFTFRIAGLALSPEFIYALPPGELVVDAGRFAVLWINRDLIEAAYDLDGAFNEAIVTASRGAKPAAIVADLDRMLGRYGAAGAITRSDQISNRYLVEELAQLRTMGLVMTPVFLGVAIFLVNLVITRLVQTEREQIGLLKAFGYSNAEVGLHYIKFVLVIAIVGAAVGWSGGLWLGGMVADVYRRYFHFPFLIFTPEFATFGLALALCIAAATLGAATATFSAVKLPPAAAMRPPPPRFARGGAAMRWFAARLDRQSRMIFRRLARHPFRAALTILGISAAMGLAVMMRFNKSATDYMLDVSFNVADRSDVFVTFAEPLSDRAILDLRKIDGVIYAEPFRAAAVLFRNGRETHLDSITGLAPSPVLNRPLDQDLVAIEVSGEGLVLSRQLAETLGVGVGDAVVAEVREGRRPALRLPVSGLVDPLIGTPAYMTIDALNRRLKEPQRASGAYLKIDPAKKELVYETLKSAPLVAGVSLRREAYENFMAMIEEGPGFFRNVMLLFSILIAAGVVYNAARIAFFERRHDLASLRVLGFTRSETGYVLLGELAALSIAALAPGALIGYGLWFYIATALSTDLYQIPVIYEASGVGYAAIVVLLSTAAAAMLVQRDIARLDLASALKTGE